MDILQENDDTISIKTTVLKQALLEDLHTDMCNLNNLSKRVCRLHTNLLFYRSEKQTVKGTVCYNAWQAFLKSVGGVLNGFYELGLSLGMSRENLDYISTYTLQTKADPVHMVLKVFAQNSDSTLDKVVEAIIKMENYQILTFVEEPLTNLAKVFVNDKDSGYCGNSDDVNIIMLKNENVNFDDLPPGLLLKENIRKMDPPVKKDKDDGRRNAEPLQVGKPLTEIKKDGKPVLFLTFATDGAQTASNIKQYVQEWDEYQGVTVLTLNDYRDEVFKNPGSFIQSCLEKADLVVPIITTEYLNEISQHLSHTLDTNENLDNMFVNLIYQKIVNYYILNGCYNFKVRCVIPKYSDVMTLTSGLAMYPMLIPWTQEDNFTEQYKAFLDYIYTKNALT